MNHILSALIFGILLTQVYSTDDISSRIYGGEALGIPSHDEDGPTYENDGQQPYIASIQRREPGRHFCGCTLIKADVALTAAHCIQGENIKDLLVVAGTVVSKWKANWNPSAQQRSIKTTYDHIDYSNPSVNDISIIILNEPFELNEFVNVIKLPEYEQRNSFVGETVRLMGWGNTEKYIQSHFLLYADVMVVSNSECAKGRDWPILDSMVCVLDTSGKKGACIGDSGGPAVLMPSSDPKTHLLIGITSSVIAGQVIYNGNLYNDCIPNRGAIYTNVAAFRKWIDPKISM